VIAAKLKGEGITPQQAEAPSRDNVIDLMAALKASLGRGERAEPKAPEGREAAPAPRKAPAKRKAPARRRA
jgi:non-homologous end joining protein Ku